MWRSLSAFVCVALAGCASVPGIPLERVGEVNAALENIPAPPQGHEFVNYSIDSTGVKARIAPAGTTAGVIQSRGSYYGSAYGGYGYGGGYGGYPRGYGGFGDYYQPITPQIFYPPSSTRTSPYSRLDCQNPWTCVPVNEPIPPGAVPGFR